MNDFVSILKIVANYGFIPILFAIIAIVVIELAKIPFKKLTAKLSEGNRKVYNTVLLILPYGIGFALYVGYSAILKETFNYAKISCYSGIVWLGAKVLYGRYEEIKNGYKTTSEKSDKVEAVITDAINSDKTENLTEEIVAAVSDEDIANAIKTLSAATGKNTDLIKTIFDKLKNNE